MEPVKKMFSSKIKYRDGPPLKIIEMAKKLGLLSEIEFEILQRVKHEQPCEFQNELYEPAIQALIQKGYIREINANS